MLLVVALFGLLVPNGLFVYWLLCEFESMSAVLADHLALAFVLDAFLATALLAYLFAKRPPGPISWSWFVALSLFGGLGFAIPFYLWLNFRRAAPGERTFAVWWRSV